MVNWVSVVDALAGGIGIIGTAGGVLAFLRSSVSSNTVAIYKDDNDALNARVSTLSQEIIDREKIITNLEGRNKALEASINLATGRVAIEDMGKALQVSMDTLRAESDRIVSQIHSCREEVVRGFSSLERRIWHSQLSSHPQHPPNERDD